MRILSRIWLLLVITLLFSSTFSHVDAQVNPEFVLENELPIDFSQYFNQSAITEIAPNTKDINELTAYTGEVEIFPETSNISVNIQIEYQLPADLDEIRINHHILSWTSSFANSELKSSTQAYPDGFNPLQISYNPITINNTITNHSLFDSYIRLDLNETVSMGDEIVIEIDFNATIPESRRRLAKMIEAGGEIMFALPHIIPLMPVYEDQGFITHRFDEVGESFYSESSYFKINVTAPTEFVVGATGTIIEEIDLGDKKITIFEAYPVRDWALVGSFDYLKKTRVVELATHNVTIHNLYLESSSVFATQDSYAARALEYFSEIFGEYAYTDYTTVQSVNFFGGMEYPTLSLINGTSSIRRMDTVSAHEIGHQWNWVMLGNDEATEGWLDEGITTFFTNLYSLKYGLMSIDDFIDTQTAVIQNTIEYNIHINQTIYEPQDDLQRSIFYYAAYTYMGQLMHDLLNTVGSERFYPIMKNYYNKYRFETVKATDLINQFVTDLGQIWPEAYFDLFLNSRMPDIDGEVVVKDVIDGKTLLSFNITAEPNIVQRLQLIVEYDDENEVEQLIKNSIVIDGNVTFDWWVDTDDLKRIQIGYNGGALADFDTAFFFGGILYRDYNANQPDPPSEPSDEEEPPEGNDNISPSADEDTPLIGLIWLLPFLIMLSQLRTVKHNRLRH